MADEVGDAVRERVGLARAGAGDHQQRAGVAAVSPVPCVAASRCCVVELRPMDRLAGGVAWGYCIQVRHLYINTVDNILVGSASWTDKTLIACGRFYPKECKSAEARLRYYATQFPLVEVDSSYYGMPTPPTRSCGPSARPRTSCSTSRLSGSSPATRPRPSSCTRTCSRRWGRTCPRSSTTRTCRRRSATSCGGASARRWSRLRQAGKLGAVHFQFAPWLLRNREGHAHVEECVERMEGLLVAVEFRNKSWFDGGNCGQDPRLRARAGRGAHHRRRAARFRQQRAGRVGSDASRAGAGAPARAQPRDLEHKGPASSSRFNYWYSGEELAALKPEILDISRKARKVHVLFNTNYEDQGQVNARLMRQVLG